MSDRRHTLLWASALATLLGPAGPGAGLAHAGGRHGKLGHHTQVVGVGIAAPVMGSAPLSLGVMAPSGTTTLGLAPVAPQTLGAGYTLVPATTAPAATAPSLGTAYTLVPTATPTAMLGAAPQAYQMVGYSLAPAAAATGSGGPTLGAAAGASPDPEVQLGQALGGANLQKIKDHLTAVIDEQTAGGQHPRRRALVRLLTDSALEFARDELHVDLVHWVPIVRTLVSQIVDDQVDTATTSGPAADTAPTRPAVGPRPNANPAPAAGPAPAPAPAPAPGGRRVIPIQASGYLVIDRIEVQGTIASTPSLPPTPTPAAEPDLQPVPAVKPTQPPVPNDPPAPAPDVTPATEPVTPTPAQPVLPPADVQRRDDGPLLPGEGNDG